MMAAEAARFGLTVKANFSKSDRAGWTSQEKSLWKSQVQMGGEKKATKFMTKYFAKKNGEAPAPKKEKAPAVDPTAAAAALAAAEPKVQLPPPQPGTMVCAGSLDWVTLGKDARAEDQNNLWSFHRIATPAQVRLVATGPSARHFIAVDTSGKAWAWGRNCSGQLGLGDQEPRAMPTKIAGLPSGKVEAAACGRHHTLLLVGGAVVSCGANSAAQLGHSYGETEGSGSSSPKGAKAAAKEGKRGAAEAFAKPITKHNKFKKVSAAWASGEAVTAVAAGAEFSVAVSAAGVAASWGHPQYGQLGHGTDGEFLEKAGKTEYSYVTEPLPIDFSQAAEGGAAAAPVAIEEVACGNSHSVARTKAGAVYTWGFGGYGRLGHRSGSDEMRPRMLEEFDGVAARSSARLVRAGAACCYAVSYRGKGQTFFWGKTKMTGEPTTHPTIEPNLNGWTVRDIGVGNTHTVTAEDSSVISWGPSPSYGACGFGDPQETGIKSSTKPKQVDGLEGLHVASVACGYAHTVAIVATDAGGAPFPKKGKKAAAAAAAGPLEALPELEEYDIARKKETYKGPTAWIMFMKATRAEISAEEAKQGKGKGKDADGKEIPTGLGFAEMGAEIGRRWQALSEDEKQEDALRKEAGFCSDSDSEDEADTGSAKKKTGKAAAKKKPKQSRAAKRRRLMAERDAEDAADWASICSTQDEEEQAEMQKEIDEEDRN